MTETMGGAILLPDKLFTQKTKRMTPDNILDDIADASRSNHAINLDLCFPQVHRNPSVRSMSSRARPGVVSNQTAIWANMVLRTCMFMCD